MGMVLYGLFMRLGFAIGGIAGGILAGGIGEDEEGVMEGVKNKIRITGEEERKQEEAATLMTLKVSYAEMSFLRNLVDKTQFELWKSYGARCAKKGWNAEELFKKFAKEPAFWQPVFTDQHCCARLLRKFNELELEVRGVLERDKQRREVR